MIYKRGAGGFCHKRDRPLREPPREVRREGTFGYQGTLISHLSLSLTSVSSPNHTYVIRATETYTGARGRVVDKLLGAQAPVPVCGVRGGIT